MQRVKAPAGRMTLEQWRGLAELAARYTPDYPLHVTTRQNLELHGVREEDLPAVQRGIDSLGLTGAAACGDSVRNIAVCPRNGCCPGTWDIGELVRAIRAAVESLPWREDLPRKFKISVSGCREACGRPWMNDVGLVANPDGGFRVILAGSLGAKPDLGLLVYDSLPLDDVLPLVVAVLRLFHAEGDRTNRSRARLRHLRQRLGEETFRSRVDELLKQEKREGHWPTPALRPVETAVPPRERLDLPLGDIAPDMVVEMVEAVGTARRSAAGNVPRFAHLCGNEASPESAVGGVERCEPGCCMSWHNMVYARLSRFPRSRVPHPSYVAWWLRASGGRNGMSKQLLASRHGRHRVDWTAAAAQRPRACRRFSTLRRRRQRRDAGAGRGASSRITRGNSPRSRGMARPGTSSRPGRSCYVFCRFRGRFR